MNYLPFEISLNILSRLHVDSVLDCKLVCKTWLNLIKDPSFVQTHMDGRKSLLPKLDENQDLPNNSSTCEIVESGFLLLQKIGDKPDVFIGDKGFMDCSLHYVEYSVDVKNKSYEIKNRKIHIPPINQTKSEAEGLANLSSCNGLVCAATHHRKLNDPINIFNPVTREYVSLPRYPIEENVGTHWMVSGFGYSKSTDQYKVVRIYQKFNGACCFQVYILGNESNDWKEEKEIPYPLFRNGGSCSKGVLVNGEIHWLDREASSITAFSLADEEFYHIASPPLGEHRTYYDVRRLSVLGDLLCLVHQKSDGFKRNAQVDIWLLRKHNDMNMQQNGTSNWNKEFTVQAETRINLIPLAFAQKGKVLFWQDDRFISCYDPKTAVLETLRKDENGHKAVTSYQAAHHINSFVSLKALGVKKCRRRLEYKAN